MARSSSAFGIPPAALKGCNLKALLIIAGTEWIAMPSVGGFLAEGPKTNEKQTQRGDTGSALGKEHIGQLGARTDLNCNIGFIPRPSGPGRLKLSTASAEPTGLKGRTEKGPDLAGSRRTCCVNQGCLLPPHCSGRRKGRKSPWNGQSIPARLIDFGRPRAK